MRRKLTDNGCLKTEREAFIQYLLDMSYTPKGLENYEWIIKCLDHFMLERGLGNYLSDIGKSFLTEMETSQRHTYRILKVMKCVIRRFDCFMEHEEYILALPLSSQESPPQFVAVLNKYLEYMRLRGLRESSIKQRHCHIKKALLKFDEFGIHGFSEITPEVIYDVYEKTSNKQSFCDALRGFLRYLSDTNIIEMDYSACVPSFKKKKPVPSIYTVAETEKFLNRPERNSYTAKRNHAIILLALRLGIRSGDIINLKIEDIDFKSKIIGFVQEKTRVAQRLELLPEIEEALLSYFSLRPASDMPNVFLSIRSPIRPITRVAVHHIVSRRLENAEIDIGERRHGGHALRMTLASELVAEKVPYDAVRKILGHDDPESVKSYVKFDIEALRSCSIEIPPVTGKLAAYMNARLGGAAQ